MPAKILDLRSALHSPKDHFKTLWREIRSTGDENIYIDSTYSFAEVEVATVTHGKILIFMPLKPIALNRNPLLSNPPSTILCPYKVLERELVSYQEEIDIVVQYIPMGDPLHLSPIDADMARNLLQTLEKECRSIGFSHNRLTAEDIIVGNDNHLYPIRYHYATMNGCKDDFSALFDLFADRAEEANRLNDINSTYTNKYCDIYDCHNGYIRFCDDGLFGYKNHKGEDIIAAQFIWAGDFCESRAVVETADGFGVIKPDGSYVIRPYLDSLYYDNYGSLFYYYDHNELCAFDYNGDPLASNDPRLDHLH